MIKTMMDGQPLNANIKNLKPRYKSLDVTYYITFISSKEKLTYVLSKR